MKNPFLDNLKKKPQAIKRTMDRILGNGQKVNSESAQRNVFKGPTQGENEDLQNIKNDVNIKQNIFNNIPPQKLEIIKADERKKTTNYATLNDKANLEMKINHQVCQVIKVKDQQLKSIHDLNPSNISIVLPKAVILPMQKQISSRQYILNCLSSIYQIIRENNEAILNLINRINLRSPRGYTYINLRLDQYNRLKQGLFFYQPANNQANSMLKLALANHIFGKLTFAVSQQYNLDILKAYYVVRSVHEQRGIIKDSSSSFFINEPVQALQQQIVLKASQQFLRNDKKILLQIYLTLLTQKPSSSRFITLRQELDILWGNLINLKKETLQIQEMAIAVFLSYWSLCDNRLKQKGNEVFLMKQKLLKANLQQNLKAKIIQIGINDILSQEAREIHQSDFQGPFKELYLFFIQNNSSNYNYQSAMQNIEKIELSNSWIKHISSYIQRLTLKEDSLFKTIYIYKVLLKLPKGEDGLSSKYLESLISKVIKQGSIIMAVLFLKDLGAKLYCPSMVSLLSKNTQKSIKMAYIREQSIIFKRIKRISYEEFVQSYLQIIFSIIINAINVSDISTLERYVSIAKIYSIDLSESEDYQFIKYCCQLFAKFPSFSPQIQKNMHELFEIMQKKLMNIQPSLQCYNSKLLNHCTCFRIIADHIGFIFKIVKDNDKCCYYAHSFIDHISKEVLSKQFDVSQLLSLVSDKIIMADSQQLLPIYTQFTRLFKDNILSYFSRKGRVSVNGIKIFYGLRKIVEWSQINSLNALQLNQITQQIRMSLLKQDRQQLIKICDALPLIVKLFVLHQLGQSNYKVRMEGWIQLHDKISGHLKDSKNGLQLFYYGATCNEGILELLLRNNMQDLANILTNSPINITSIYYLLNLGIILMNSTLRVDPKQRHYIITVITGRTIQYFDTRQMPVLIYSKLTSICSKMMNSLGFGNHMQIVKKGLKAGQLSLQIDDEHEIYKYYTYLLCLFIVISPTIDFNQSQATNRVVMSIQVFTSIAIYIIPKQSSSQQVINIYLIKYLQIIQFYLAYPIFFQLIDTQFSKFGQKFKAILCQNKQLLIQYERVQRKIEDYINGMNKKEKSLTDGVVSALVQLKHIGERQRRKQQQRKLLTLLKSSNNKIEIKDAHNIQQLLESKSLFTMALVYQFIKRTDFVKSNKDVAKIFINYLLQFTLKTSDGQLQKTASIKYFLAIANHLVSNSAISGFLLQRSIKNIFNDILCFLNEIINVWAQTPNIKLFKSFDNLGLKLSYLPNEWKKNGRAFQAQNFTVWDLLLFRHKVDVIKEILLFLVNMNGLLQNKSYTILSDVNNFLAFFAQNMDQLLQKESSQKIKAINKFYIEKEWNTDESILLDNPICIKDLTETCLSIANSLNNLDVEVQYRTYNIIDKYAHEASK